MPRNPNLKPNVFLDCEVCGAHVERYMTPYDQVQYPPRYCSRSCAGIAHRGPGHPLWQGGRRIASDDGYVLVWAILTMDLDGFLERIERSETLGPVLHP